VKDFRQGYTDVLRRRRLHSRRYRGFTLIELMITVLIVAILAAIAYPSYREQIQKARRADGQGVLLQLAMVMERIYTEEGTYKPSGSWPVLGSSGSAVFPDKSPIEGDETYYTLSIQNRTTPDDGSNYRLLANPANEQQDDRCGVLTLDDNGVRGIQSAQAGVTVNDCW
jgi:type IV pilus assembly protein PilE